MIIYISDTAIPNRPNEFHFVHVQFSFNANLHNKDQFGSLVKFIIDEDGSGNLSICHDIYNTFTLRDSGNLGKYYYDNSDSSIYERDNWIPRRLR